MSLGLTQRWPRRRPDTAAVALLAALAYLPMLVTAPGRVSADTKTYLTLDPGQLLARATSMWDPSVGAGTVPHQNIGYLFPLGPYYWLMDTIGLPDWITQRLLWATLAFAAAWGTLRLLRWLGWGMGAALVAAVAYGFSPYLLSYLARLSAILGPWAALPWMILLAARAAREQTWRPAAQFALVVALVGSVNATSLVFVGLAPVLWLVADAATRRVEVRHALAAAGRIGLLSAGVSAWWIAGLVVQGRYGLPILDYTETYQAVASASTPPEILRGLGYWFFYGGDRLDPWVGPARPYVNHPGVMFVGFGVAGLSMLGLVTKFVGRASMVMLLLVGLTVSVGAAPRSRSSWYGTMFETFATDTTTGAALRSTPRAAPLVLLALACGLGAGVEFASTWWSQHRPEHRQTARVVVPAAAVVVLMMQMFPWFTAQVTSESLLRPDPLPTYRSELADHLDTGDRSGRIYALPGADFASYRWGGTVDPVLPGMTDRSVLYRELVPQGGAGTADLLNAFERRLSEGWFEPETLPVFANLMGVETVVVRNDLEHERYRLARPGPLWTDVTSVLGTPDHAGPLVSDEPRITLVDEITLARADAAATFPVVAAFDLAPTEPLRLVAATAPIIMAGSGDGIVDVAAAGLIDGTESIIYAATLADRNVLHDGEGTDGEGPDGGETGANGDTEAAGVAGTDPWWIVTDSNRRQGRRWSSIGANLGALESSGPLQLDPDPGDHDLDVFDSTFDEQTVALHVGPVTDVRASSYGSRIVFTPEDAPAFAIDGDPTTAWRAGVAEKSTGLRWEVGFNAPTDVDHVVLLQPQIGANSRFITEVHINVNGSDGPTELDVTLDETSRVPPGQVVELASRGATLLGLEVRADNVGDLNTFAGQPGVGFAEISVVQPDGSVVVDDRVVRLPRSSTLDVSVTDRLTYVMTRQRIDPATPNRRAPEAFLVRQFDTPDDRAFVLTGEARLSSAAPDDIVNALLSPVATDTTATASTRLQGSVESRGAAAIDGDPATAWQGPFDAEQGAFLTVTSDGPIVAEQLTLTWRDDGRHTVPTSLALSDGTSTYDLSVPPSTPVDGLATATIPLPAPIDGSTITLTIVATSGTMVPEYYSRAPRELPFAIAEVGFTDSDVSVESVRDVDPACRSDLIRLDGAPVPVVVDGSTLDRELRLTGCGGPLVIEGGEHRIEATAGRLSGLDLDRLVFDAATTTEATDLPSGEPGAPHVTSSKPTAIDATIGATDSPAWLILPQSLNAGWRAELDGSDLGPPMLIDGYANGWAVPVGAGDRNIELRWAPQRSVRLGLAISAAGALVVALLLLVPRQREERPGAQTAATAQRSGSTAGSLGASVIGPVVVVVVFMAVGGVAAASTAAILLLLAHRRSPVRHRLARIVVTVICVGWGTVSGLIIALETRYDFADGPDGPSRFGWAAPVTWAVVAAIVVLVYVESTGTPDPDRDKDQV